MDRPARHRPIEGRAMIARLAHNTDQPAEHRLPDRHGDRRARPVYSSTTLEPGCASKRHGTHIAWIEMLLNLGNQTAGLVPPDFHRFVYVRQIMFGERDIHHRTTHGNDPSPILGARLPRHWLVVGLRMHGRPPSVPPNVRYGRC